MSLTLRTFTCALVGAGAGALLEYSKPFLLSGASDCAVTAFAILVGLFSAILTTGIIRKVTGEW